MGTARYYFSRKELEEQAIQSWRSNAEEYRNLIPEYHRLLANKVWLKEHEPGCKSMTLRKLPKDVLSGLVKIPFFDIINEEGALAYIKELDVHGLNRLIATISTALSSYSYVTIKSKNFDYRYEIANHNSRKPKIALDPNYPCRAGQKYNSKKAHKNGDD
ncbi:hypothetical protein J6V85_00450 [Candidatus Saccharibacteria bacterium]|nr:hypothetical protein [Candidatus Saccharibacteria bacterium]